MKFTKSEAIKFGWETTKKNLWLLVLISVISLFVNSNSGFKYSYSNTSGWHNEFGFFGIIFFILKIVIDMGIIKISLKLYSDSKTKLQDLLSETSRFVDFFLASLIYMILVGLGMVLLVIPGIILGLRLQFFSYLIIDKNLKAVDAVKKSWKMTKNSTWNLFLLALLYILIAMLGILALGVGILVAIPVIMLSTTYVYKKLSA